MQNQQSKQQITNVEAEQRLQQAKIDKLNAETRLINAKYEKKQVMAKMAFVISGLFLLLTLFVIYTN